MNGFPKLQERDDTQSSCVLGCKLISDIPGIFSLGKRIFNNWESNLEKCLHITFASLDYMEQKKQ
uniref:Uncharacterized protein n=1 Tax=Rhizophora mucronata TaxID=61149 RepID=A0A2P2MJ12_RHIMU